MSGEIAGAAGAGTSSVTEIVGSVEFSCGVLTPSSNCSEGGVGVGVVADMAVEVSIAVKMRMAVIIIILL
jgi:hypothetical protein